MDSKALFNVSYGLYVVTAKDGSKDNGCIANAIMQVTSNPARIAICLNKENLTCDIISKTNEFNISILSTDSKFSTFKHWGYQSGKTIDKLEGISYKRAKNDIVYLDEETNACISAKVSQKIDLGTHFLFIADIVDSFIISDTPSVTYDYYQKNIKEIQNNESKKGYICLICGYIYEGDVLPEDFVCPICKHGASDFKKL